MNAILTTIKVCCGFWLWMLVSGLVIMWLELRRAEVVT